MKYLVQNLIKYLLTLIFLVTLVGCLNVKTINQNQYALKVHLPKSLEIYESNNKKTIQIRSSRSSLAFSGSRFIYRLSEINYVTDKYNVFFTSPAQQIKQLTADYLRTTNLFHYVDDGAMVIETQYDLFPELLAIYADYRDRNHPSAFIQMRFIMIENNTKNIILDKNYQAKVPLLQKDPASLVYAWNQGLTKILMSLSQDIRKKTQ